MKKKLSQLVSLIFICALIFMAGILKLSEYGAYEQWEIEAFKNEESYKDMRIFVDIIENRLYVLSDGKVVKEYPCAAGKPSTPSPIGEWKIVGKDTWGEGFGGRWMAFNVPWGKYGIHGTIYPNSIGWQSSKGCIRMRNSDVAELYKITKIGTPVTIYGGPYGPFGYGFRNLRPGAIGSDVLEVQKRLKTLGYYKGPLSGRYDGALESAVYRFQKDKKLPKSQIIGLRMYSAMGIILFE